jgi:hypothetical protein
MPDDVSISQTNPQVAESIAKANQAEGSGLHSDRAAHATAALSAWADARRSVPSATPKDAVEAGQRLEYLTTKDRNFQERYTAGETSARREFELLTTAIAGADSVSLALGGVVPADSVDMNSGALPGPREQVAGVQHLREVGFSDAAIEQVYRGDPRFDDGSRPDGATLAAKVSEAENWMARAMKDGDFRKRLLSGDQDAAAQFHRANALIAVGKR